MENLSQGKVVDKAVLFLLEEFGFNGDWHIYKILVWIGFAWVIFKSFVFVNKPTLDDPEDAVISPEEQKRVKRQNHKDRLTTAAFYVPFVPGASILIPAVMKFFVMIMVLKGLSEYLQITSVLSDVDVEEKKDKKKSGGASATSKQTHRGSTGPVIAEREYKLDVSDRALQVISLVMVAGAWTGRWDYFAICTFFSVTLVLSWHMFMVVFEKSTISRATLTRLGLHVFGLIWIGWCSCHVMMLCAWSEQILSPTHQNFYYSGGGIVALMLWTSWIGDAAAYYVGSKFGAHKAFPHVSPKKSFEGIAATLLFSVLLGLFAKYLQSSGHDYFRFPNIDSIHYIIFGLIIGGFDIIGDVTESFVKRLGRVKDSGTFFTGHGGVMDRFDSFYIVAPVTVYYVWLVLM